MTEPTPDPTPCDHPEGLTLTGYTDPGQGQALLAHMQCPVCEQTQDVRTMRSAAQLDQLMANQGREPR